MKKFWVGVATGIGVSTLFYVLRLVWIAKKEENNLHELHDTLADYANIDEDDGWVDEDEEDWGDDCDPDDEEFYETVEDDLDEDDFEEVDFDN